MTAEQIKALKGPFDSKELKQLHDIAAQEKTSAYEVRRKKEARTKLQGSMQ